VHHTVLGELVLRPLPTVVAHRVAKSPVRSKRGRRERPETQSFVARLREVVHGEPVYRHYDELYRTDQ
jgi:hypothetical protein